ncbi:hypothetical protein AMATHDRAFT_7078 [Amanita thiersii Skay4041]|uniref:Protein kinase domain-containing protein n=1 Tax=Amanita thiersii Skay4041 TaxID=703135 RepID=A0A2A9NCP9_9AGAR|nr:hypothetical protein AMATHDRAFT_7078 [Amanita thiersii Skay4041]
MLSHGGLRNLNYALGLFELELLYYDHRSAYVQTTTINFKKDPDSLIALISCMNQFNNYQRWGYALIIDIPSRDSFYNRVYNKSHVRREPNVVKGLFNALKPKPNNNVVPTLGDIVSYQHALIGRGTCVVHIGHAAVLPGVIWNTDGWKVVMKLSFSPVTRTRECDIMQGIIDSAGNNRDILNHFPEIIHLETIVWDDAGLQVWLTQYIDELFAFKYERRKVEILSMDELHPITELTATQALAPMIRDVFTCYRWVYQVAHMMHRDISLNNLMYKTVGDIVHGVLADFDLAVKVGREDRASMSKQRTGTKPYMAGELLKPVPPKHMYRHDLESLFYVIVVLTTIYHEGQIIEEKHPIKDWFHAGSATLSQIKKAFFTEPIPWPTLHFERMRRWTGQLRILFSNGYRAKADHQQAVDDALLESIPAPPAFEDETFDGLINFAKFAKILDINVEA